MTPSDASRAGEPQQASRGQASERSGRADDRRAAWSGLDQASIMSVELLSAIFVWGGGGWLADRWLGTEPWLLAIGILVGFAAGLYLVWLRSAKDDRPAGGRTDSDRPPGATTEGNGT